MASWYFSAFRARTWSIQVDTVACWKLTLPLVTVQTWVYFFVSETGLGDTVLLPRGRYKRTMAASIHQRLTSIRASPHPPKIPRTFALPSATPVGFQVAPARTSGRRKFSPHRTGTQCLCVQFARCFTVKTYRMGAGRKTSERSFKGIELNCVLKLVGCGEPEPLVMLARHKDCLYEV